MEQSNSEDKFRGQAGLLILKPAPAEVTEQRRAKERSLPEVPLKIRQGPAQIDQPEYTGSRPESGEAIVSSDWLRPVTRGGWRTGFPDRGRGLADVS